MADKCKGKNCNSTDGSNHSIECLYEHFLAYTGFDRSDQKIRKAYFDGYDAGIGVGDVESLTL